VSLDWIKEHDNYPQANWTWTEKELFRIQEMPDRDRREHLVSLMRDDNEEDFGKWPFIYPIWMCAMLVGGLDAPQAIYLVRTGQVRLEGERTIKGKKITFRGSITNPDALVMFDHYPVRLRDTLTLWNLELREPTETSEALIKLEKRTGCKPSEANLNGIFDVDQFPQGHPVFEYLFECTVEDDTICLPMKYYDLKDFWDGKTCRVDRT